MHSANFDLVSLGWLDEDGRPPQGLPDTPALTLRDASQPQQTQQQTATPLAAPPPAKGGKAAAGGKLPPPLPKPEGKRRVDRQLAVLGVNHMESNEWTGLSWLMLREHAALK